MFHQTSSETLFFTRIVELEALATMLSIALGELRLLKGMIARSRQDKLTLAIALDDLRLLKGMIARSRQDKLTLDIALDDLSC